MIDPGVEAFAKLLSEQDTDEDRLRLLKQAKLRASAITPDESIGTAPIITLGAYLEQTIEIPPRLVEPALFVRGGIFSVVGGPGYGKTSLLLNGLVSWAAGRPLFPDLDEVLHPCGPLKSLIIENEGAPAEFHRKLGIMLNKGPLNDEQQSLARENLLIWGDGGYSGLKLDDGAYVDRLRRGLEEHRPDIVFLEPFHGLWSGDENSATEMRKVLDTMQELATTFDCCMAIAHHERKSGAGEDGEQMYAARGSGALSGAVTIMSHHKPVKGGQQREWSVSKSRHAQKPAPVRMTYNPLTDWYAYVAESKGEREVLAVLSGAGGDELYLKDIAAELQEPEHRVRAILTKLTEGDNARVRRTPRTHDHGIGYRLAGAPTNDDNGGLSI